MNRGVFITFEGIEGSGKSTQASMLADYLRERGLDVDLTREPGGTKVGDMIREVLLDTSVEEMHPGTELLLYLAARSEHVSKRIRKKLYKDKSVVICDRYTLSTLSYQAGGRKLDAKTVSRLCNIAAGGLKPDLTILVDLDVEKAFKRLLPVTGDEPREHRSPAGKQRLPALIVDR